MSEFKIGKRSYPSNKILKCMVNCVMLGLKPGDEIYQEGKTPKIVLYIRDSMGQTAPCVFYATEKSKRITEERLFDAFGVNGLDDPRLVDKIANMPVNAMFIANRSMVPKGGKAYIQAVIMIPYQKARERANKRRYEIQNAEREERKDIKDKEKTNKQEKEPEDKKNDWW